MGCDAHTTLDLLANLGDVVFVVNCGIFVVFCGDEEDGLFACCPVSAIRKKQKICCSTLSDIINVELKVLGSTLS